MIYEAKNIKYMFLFISCYAFFTISRQNICLDHRFFAEVKYTWKYLVSLSRNLIFYMFYEILKGIY